MLARLACGLLWLASTAMGLRVGVLARHLRTSRVGIIKRIETRGEKVKVTFEDDCTCSWQRPSNFILLPGHVHHDGPPVLTAEPAPVDSLRLAGVELMPKELVEQILSEWCTSLGRAGATSSSATSDVRRRLGIPTRRIRLVLHVHGQPLSAAAAEATKKDQALLTEFLSRPQMLTGHALPRRYPAPALQLTAPRMH